LLARPAAIIFRETGLNFDAVLMAVIALYADSSNWATVV
jgi:hypothetical protein